MADFYDDIAWADSVQAAAADTQAANEAAASYEFAMPDAVANNNWVDNLLGLGVSAGINYFGADDPVIPKAGYQGSIPKYDFVREQVPNTFDPNRRPGSSGRRYFTDGSYAPQGTAPAAPTAGGLAALNASNAAIAAAGMAPAAGMAAAPAGIAAAPAGIAAPAPLPVLGSDKEFGEKMFQESISRGKAQFPNIPSEYFDSVEYRNHVLDPNLQMVSMVDMPTKYFGMGVGDAAAASDKAFESWLARTGTNYTGPVGSPTSGILENEMRQVAPTKVHHVLLLYPEPGTGMRMMEQEGRLKFLLAWYRDLKMKCAKLLLLREIVSELLTVKKYT